MLANKAADSGLNKYNCPPPPVAGMLRDENARIVFYSDTLRLSAIHDQRIKCADSRRPIVIGFHFLSFMKKGGPIFALESPRFRWCCSKNILADYSIDPKQVCCGLAGSSSPNFFSKSEINVDNPPCCRTLARQRLCEPLSYPKFPSPVYNQECPALSGNVNTKDLTEDMPLFAPRVYFHTGEFRDPLIYRVEDAKDEKKILWTLLSTKNY